MRAAAFGGAGKNAAVAHGFQKRRVIRIAGHIGEIVIIQPGAAQFLLFKIKTEWFNQVQLTAGVGRKTDNVAGVRRDLGFVQCNVKHGANSPLLEKAQYSER